MERILVTYATMAGSTGEVAGAVAEELKACGFQVDVLPVGEVRSLDGYRAVVVGGPMIMGWHRSAAGFLRRHRKSLRNIPWAAFFTAMHLTKTGDMQTAGLPVFVDETLPRPPEKPDSLNFKERYASLANYLKPILRSAAPARPASIGAFGGRLEYGRLKWWAVLFAMVIIQAPPGEMRNWKAIRGWAASLPAAFQLEVK